jgi:hypothetical protein
MDSKYRFALIYVVLVLITISAVRGQKCKKVRGRCKDTNIIPGKGGRCARIKNGFCGMIGARKCRCRTGQAQGWTKLING